MKIGDRVKVKSFAGSSRKGWPVGYTGEVKGIVESNTRKYKGENRMTYILLDKGQTGARFLYALESEIEVLS